MAISYSDSPDVDSDADTLSWAGVTRASGFDTFATTPTSANLRTLITDETGSGSLVFADTPSLTTPTIAGATLSGTLAGTPTASGAWTFGATMTSRTILPSSASAFNLGSPAAPWSNVYADAMTLGGTALGTAAIKATGTSGNTVPLLDGANTWSGVNLFASGSGIKNADPTFYMLKANGTRIGYWSLSDLGAWVFENEVSGGAMQLRTTGGGALTFNGVAIPTISSSDTLSNKTISSPTLSGTVAGSPTYAARQTFSGLGTTNASGSLGIKLLRTSGQVNGVMFTGLTVADPMIYTPVGTDDVAIGFDTGTGVVASTAVTFYQAGGMVCGGATGGAKGAGTINATAVYDDNSLLTDLVLDMAVEGRFDEVAYVNHPIASEVQDWWFDADRYAQFWKVNRHLPGMIQFTPNTKPSTGESITRLTAVVETQAALIESLNQRLKAAGL